MKKLWEKWRTSGLPLPHAYDSADKQPSFRLLVAYVAFIIAALSVVSLHKFEHLTATWTALTFWALAMIFYMLKKLSRAKVDLDDRSVELDSQPEAKNMPKDVDNPDQA